MIKHIINITCLNMHTYVYVDMCIGLCVVFLNHIILIFSNMKKTKGYIVIFIKNKYKIKCIFKIEKPVTL